MSKIFVPLLLLSTLAIAQDLARKPLTLRGTVEQIDRSTNQIKVANEPIPGGMNAMSMTYSVDQQGILSKLKPGDHIIAKFDEETMTLRDISIQNPAGMSLEDFERLALANNPTIAEAQLKTRIYASRATQAGLYPNPVVGYYGDEIRGGYTGGGKQGGFISQTIVTGGKRQAARHVAEMETREAETNTEAQRMRVLSNVRLLFYQVLADQKLVDIRGDLVKLASDATQTSYQLANVGQADRPDVLQSEVEQQQVNVSLRVAEQSLRSSWRTLSAVIGNPALPQTRLEGDLDAIPDLNYDESLALTLAASPQMNLAQQAIEHAEASLVQARTVPIPDLQLYANLTQNYEPLDTTRRPTGLDGGVQIGVQLPIFNHNRDNIAAAKAEIEVAKQELARLKLQITRDLAVLFRDYDSARVTVQQYKTEVLPRAEQAYRLYRENYQKMAGAYPQTLLSQKTLFQLEADYVQALASAWQAALAIRGFGLVDGLSTTLR